MQHDVFPMFEPHMMLPSRQLAFSSGYTCCTSSGVSWGSSGFSEEPYDTSVTIVQYLLSFVRFSRFAMENPNQFADRRQHRCSKCEEPRITFTTLSRVTFKYIGQLASSYANQ